ncbi:putative FAD synthetase [Blumeria hordei DH14]|uniref:FAD synthase n=1 Tax=Blumeria graminis f. sp. hordei (strain DH14) TaxID=546991 RepID=N1JDS9_BLUG1|nr:putative FAD synthetase [Blumeria hordei DH14]
MIVTPPRFANKYDFCSLGLHLQQRTPHGFWPPRMTPSATYEPIPVAVNDCRPQLDTTEDRSIQAICEQLAGKVNSFLESDAPTPLLRRVQTQTRSTLAVIVEALERYSLEEISISYNGGKDCLVLLVLYLSALAPTAAHMKSRTLPAALPSVYVIAPHPFSEVDDFVTASVSEYHLDLARYAMPMKNAFITYLEDYPKIKAILVGTRRTDPHGKFLTHFDETDSGWPSFMRIHPVIDWQYAEIWAARFLRHLEIPYCPLYDDGYTSLGGKSDTRPNPTLHRSGQQQNFRPAYELQDDHSERLGRDG